MSLRRAFPQASTIFSSPRPETGPWRWIGSASAELTTLGLSEPDRRVTRSVHCQIEDVEPVVAGDDVVETLRLQARREIQLSISDPFIELLPTHERSGRIEEVASRH